MSLGLRWRQPQCWGLVQDAWDPGTVPGHLWGPWEVAVLLGSFVRRANSRMNWLAGVRGLLSCPRSAWPVPMPEAAAPSLGGALLGSCHLPVLPQVLRLG